MHSPTRCSYIAKIQELNSAMSFYQLNQCKGHTNSVGCYETEHAVHNSNSGHNNVRKIREQKTNTFFKLNTYKNI